MMTDFALENAGIPTVWIRRRVLFLVGKALSSHEDHGNDALQCKSASSIDPALGVGGCSRPSSLPRFLPPISISTATVTEAGKS